MKNIAASLRLDFVPSAVQVRHKHRNSRLCVSEELLTLLRADAADLYIISSSLSDPIPRV